MTIKQNFFVLTGGPGSGKSTIIDTLSAMGYKTVQEVGRSIIQQQMESCGDALPWDNRERYSQLMLSHSIRDYKSLIDKKELYFFDRGVPDVLGYRHLERIRGNKEYLEATQIYRYNPVVFIFPPWREIYANDRERKQDFELAKATYHVMVRTYKEAGYSLVEVPRKTINKRLKFIEDRITQQEI